MRLTHSCVSLKLPVRRRACLHNEETSLNAPVQWRGTPVRTGICGLQFLEGMSVSWLLGRGGGSREPKTEEHSVHNDLAPKWQGKDLNPACLSLKHTLQPGLTLHHSKPQR